MAVFELRLASKNAGLESSGTFSDMMRKRVRRRENAILAVIHLRNCLSDVVRISTFTPSDSLSGTQTTKKDFKTLIHTRGVSASKSKLGYYRGKSENRVRFGKTWTCWCSEFPAMIRQRGWRARVSTIAKAW